MSGGTELNYKKKSDIKFVLDIILLVVLLILIITVSLENAWYPMVIAGISLLFIAYLGQYILTREWLLRELRKEIKEKEQKTADSASQILDTTFHFMRSIADGSVSELTKPIVIGAHNWIGNRSNIMKGCILPDYTIVAAGSLCNKHYDFPQYSLIAGTPCKLIKTGIYRCLDDEERVIKNSLLLK